MEQLNLGDQIIQFCREIISKIYLKKCPILYHLCYDPIGTHKNTRTLFGFFMGFSMGFYFYEMIIIDLLFDQLTSLIMGAFIIILLSIGCAISMQVRCISLLTIPSFFGRSGRSLLKALVLGYVITGPIFNLTFNGKEVARTFSCTSQLTYNLTKTRFDLMLKPFKQALLSMETDADELKDALSSVKDLTSPIVEEIEGEEEMRRLNEENDYFDELQNDTKRSEEIEEKSLREQAKAKTKGEIYEAKYKAKIEARCQEQLNKGSEKCRIMFADAYDECYDKVSVAAAWLLCWPMKLTFICNIVQALGGSSICDPEGKVDPGIGEKYAALKESKIKLSENLKDATLNYKIKIAKPAIDIHGATDSANAIMHDLNSKKKVFISTIILVKRCLTLIFLKIILSAQKYHEDYLSEIEFDNIYITTYFRKIDARRKARGSFTLMPLKKIEKQSFINPFGLIQSKYERKNLTGQTVKLILEMITATAFVLLDRLFFETLDLVRRHAYMEYTQTGHHDMSLEIRGTGVIASLVRSLIRGFNIKKRIKIVTTNEACLPRPKRLPSYIIFKIYGTYLGIWLMLLGTAYTQRMRRVICSFFYRKREKRRILYMYNETLRRRLGYFRFMKAKVKNLIRSQQLEQNIDPWLALRTRYPKIFGWLKFFACSRDKCLICEEIEPRKNSKYIKCTTPGCPSVYCHECWRDIGEKCLVCDLQESGSDDYDDDDDQDDQDDEYD